MSQTSLRISLSYPLMQHTAVPFTTVVLTSLSACTCCSLHLLHLAAPLPLSTSSSSTTFSWKTPPTLSSECLNFLSPFFTIPYPMYSLSWYLPPRAVIICLQFCLLYETVSSWGRAKTMSFNPPWPAQYLVQTRAQGIFVVWNTEQMNE